MPITYTNRKGVTYTLYQVRAVAGQSRYVVGRQSKGEPVDEIPAGFRVSENASGVVSLVKDQPSLVLPEEVAAVETAVQRLPRSQDYRVVAKHDRIEIYVNVEPSLVDSYHKKLAAGQALPDLEDDWRELDELWAHFTPVLRFVLIDPERRWFRADEKICYWGTDEWVWLGQSGHADALADAIVPSIITAAFDDALTAEAPPRGLAGTGTTVGRVSGRARAQPTSVYRLKVTLMHLRPPIWRRLLVSSDITLDRLHDVLQVAMGWDDDHLHQFQIDGMTFSDPRFLDDTGNPAEWTVRLDQVAPYPKTRFRYDYDFGDGWEHEILVEAVQPPEPGIHYPACIAGKRACPPEDCGGVWGYADLLEALADPHNPEHAERLEWIGGPFDPEAFDLDTVTPSPSLSQARTPRYRRSWDRSARPGPGCSRCRRKRVAPRRSPLAYQ